MTEALGLKNAKRNCIILESSQGESFHVFREAKEILGRFFIMELSFLYLFEIPFNQRFGKVPYCNDTCIAISIFTHFYCSIENVKIYKLTEREP